MTKTIDFTANNLKPLSDWLKKFLLIEKSLLLEVDEENKCFIAKSYNEEKSVVKYSKISFLDAGLTLKKSSTDKLVKIGIYAIQRLMKSFEHFSQGDFQLSIQYDDLVENDSYVGLAILLKGPSVKVKIDCTSLGIFKYISNDLFFNTIANTQIVTKFELSPELIEKINSLCELDKEYKFIEWVVKNNKVYLRGKSFELELAENGPENFILSIYKEQFSKIDYDSYTVELGEEKLIYRSKNNDTVTVNSMVVKDDKYEESSLDF